MTRILRPLGTDRNSRGTESELTRNRDLAGSNRMGTDWGVGRFTIEQTTEDVDSDPPLGRKRASEGDGSRHRRPARAPSGDPRERPAPRSGTSRTSDQHGPEPGHLMSEARSERTEAGDRSNGVRTGPERRARTAVIREGRPAPENRRRARPPNLRKPCARR